MGKNFSAEITENKSISQTYFLLKLNLPKIAEEPSPGQFYMINACNTYDPLLKRPFSVFRSSEGKLQFLYRVCGRGTELIARKKPGENLCLVGPLGNGYPKTKENSIPLLIAGGTGMASLFFLAESMSDKAHFFYGGKTADDILMKDELSSVVKELIISTDEGSLGEKGTVVDSLEKFLSEHMTDNLVVYACGPSAMLKSVAKIVSKNKIESYVSVEENMACGIGVCMGCAVKTKSGYKRVCKEGPVFEIGEIEW